jgi:hypothetical protein
MVNSNYCPFSDPVLLNIIFRVEIPAQKKHLIQCLYILHNEWGFENHTKKFWDAGQDIGDFMKSHLI